MEVKVLAAVFLTLFGMAVAMGQGQLSAEDLTDVSEIVSRFQDNLRSISSSGGGLLDGIGGGGGSSTQSANTSLRASFTAAEDRTSIRIREKVDTIEVNGSEVNISVAGLETSPESASIVLRNYTGSLRFDGNVTMDGSVDVVSFGDLRFDSASAKDITIYVDDPERVRVDPLPKTDFVFRQVDGWFTSEGQFDFQNGTAELRSFTGTFEKRSGGNYSIDGRVHSAVLEEGNSRTEIGGAD